MPRPTTDQRHIVQSDRAKIELVESGERMLIACVGGGPSTSRLVQWPPPLEITEVGGTYVLVDDGPEADWWYEWIPIS